MNKLQIIDRVNSMYPLESIDFKAGVVEAAMSGGKIDIRLELTCIALLMTTIVVGLLITAGV